MFYKTDIESYIQNATDIDGMIAAFEKMCSHRNSVVDDLLFVECGNVEFKGKTEYCISLVRQYKDNVFSDEDTQLRLDIYYPAQEIGFKNRRMFKMHFSTEQTGGSFRAFFKRLRQSALLKHLKIFRLEPTHYEISEIEL